METLAIGILVSALVGVVAFAVKKVREINHDDQQEEGAESCARWMERMSKRKLETFTEDDAVREIPKAPKVAEVAF